jgi:cell division protein FtsZ
MFEVDEAARIISNAADPDANIIFGAVVKDEMADKVRITVIATGFDETRSRLAQFTKTQREAPVVEGFIGEKPIVQTPDEIEEEEEEPLPVEAGTNERLVTDENIDVEEDDQDDDDDIFGKKFEIPAFLRKN